MSHKAWFRDLFGFDEETPAQVRRHLTVCGPHLTSLANGRVFRHGRLLLPSLSSLRASNPAAPPAPGPRLTLRVVQGDVRALLALRENDGALFQAASQFNLLEMPSPDVGPERGVAGYAADATQGPACAAACAAGTVFRNYLAEVGGGVGQTRERQIDCVAEMGRALGNERGEVWEMRNGYAMGKEEGLRRAGERVRAMADEERERVKGMLRIGVQEGTEVTAGGGNVVSQAYCAAFPVAYSGVETGVWEEVAQVLLEACYEATLRAGVENWRRGGSNKVFLTLVGGGVFGNKLEWIVAAIEKAVEIMQGSGLDVRVVSHRGAAAEVKALER